MNRNHSDQNQNKNNNNYNNKPHNTIFVSLLIATILLSIVSIIINAGQAKYYHGQNFDYKTQIVIITISGIVLFLSLAIYIIYTFYFKSKKRETKHKVIISVIIVLLLIISIINVYNIFFVYGQTKNWFNKWSANRNKSTENIAKTFKLYTTDTVDLPWAEFKIQNKQEDIMTINVDVNPKINRLTLQIKYWKKVQYPLSITVALQNEDSEKLKTLGTIKFEIKSDNVTNYIKNIDENIAQAATKARLILNTG